MACTVFVFIHFVAAALLLYSSFLMTPQSMLSDLQQTCLYEFLIFPNDLVRCPRLIADILRRLACMSSCYFPMPLFHVPVPAEMLQCLWSMPLAHIWRHGLYDISILVSRVSLWSLPMGPIWSHGWCVCVFGFRC